MKVLIHLSAELGELVVKTRNMIGNFSKAKAAKLIRELVDRFLDMKSATGREVLVSTRQSFLSLFPGWYASFFTFLYQKTFLKSLVYGSLFEWNLVNTNTVKYLLQYYVPRHLF